MKKTIYNADEIDFIHSDEVEQEYGIGTGKQINLLDSGKLTAFKRTPGRWTPKYPSMEPGAPEPYPEEGLPVVDGERKAEYRLLWPYEAGGLTREDVKRFYFSRSEVESLAKLISKKETSDEPPAENEKKTGTRSRPTEGIYIAAADRAETLIQDMIKLDSLPQTRKKKMEILKTDKKFMKIIAALEAQDNHLIRRLNEVRPGLWKMGKSSNTKYRPKSIY